MYLVQVQLSGFDRVVLGDSEDLESAKVMAENYLGVEELLWTVTGDTVWSDETIHGDKLAVIFYIHKVAGNGNLLVTDSSS